MLWQIETYSLSHFSNQLSIVAESVLVQAGDCKPVGGRFSTSFRFFLRTYCQARASKWVAAMTFIVADQPFQEETTSKVLRIMMFSQRMSDCRQSDTRRFAIPANLFGTQPVRPQTRQHFADNSGNTGLRSEESS